MTRIIKLIWRLDFNASYAYIDRRGTALSILSNTVGKFWDVVGDGAQHMSFVGRTSDDKAYRVMSIEAMNMNGSFEWPEGIDLQKVLQTDDFKSVNKIVVELLKHYEVKAVARAGLRCFCVASFADGKRDSHKRMMQHIGQGSIDVVESKLGAIDDAAVVYEGQTADKIKYRAQYGPFDKKNAILVLERKPTDHQLNTLSGNNDLFFDIDLFETEISFVEHSLYRWATTKVAKAVDFVSTVAKTV